MLQFDEYKIKLNNLKPALEELSQALNLPSAEQELERLRREMDEAVAHEAFEQAAQLRDQIRALTARQEPAKAVTQEGETQHE